MTTQIEKFGDSLVQLDLSEKENINMIIKELNEQIKAEIDNNREFRTSDYKIKLIFMKNIIKILKMILEQHETLLDTESNSSR